MKSIRTHSVIAVAASLLLFVAAGCGSSGGGSTTTTTSASATETWASGVCSSITTWQAAITSAVASLKSDPTKSGLQTAAGDAKSATETLASDLKGLGKPDTPAGQQAKDSLDQLSTSLQKDVTTIENAVKGVSGASGVLHRRPDGDGHARDDADGGQDDVRQPPGTRREGRAEERVRELERLQHPDEQRSLRRIGPGDTARLGAPSAFNVVVRRA